MTKVLLIVFLAMCATGATAAARADDSSLALDDSSPALDGSPAALDAVAPGALELIAELPVPSPPPPLSPSGWTLLDGFEHPNWPDPNLWILSRDEPPTWWPSVCRAREGTHSLWAFGGPTSRGEVPCAAPVPAGISSSITMRLDLRQATAAHRLDLFFDTWIAFPPGSQSGLFVSLLVPNGQSFDRVVVFGATSDAGEWATPARRLDLTALADITAPTDVYDLRGGLWYVEWLAYAPNGANAGSGAFIDNVNLVWEPDPAVATPTIRPTLPPTSTPSPTATRQWTATPTPPPAAFLPLVANKWVAYPTATAEASPTGMPVTPEQ